MAASDQKIIFLNWLVSRSACRAREATPPTIAARELFELLKKRMENGWAIEFPTLASNKISDDQDETKRIAENKGHTCIRLADVKISETTQFRYVTLLLKYLDSNTKGMSVEDLISFQGREIVGESDERGVKAAHLCVRLPLVEGGFEDGRYRCTVDSAPPITRSVIERFLCKQIHRETAEWTFSVMIQKRGKPPRPKEYKYTPRLELVADVGRTLPIGGPELSSLVFTRRGERQSVAALEVTHKDFLATTEIKISANQAPVDPEERKTWVDGLMSYFSGLGFESKVYYRHVNGTVFGGDVHHDIDGATDILICPKAFLDITTPISAWEPKVNSIIDDGMKTILDNDELWEHRKK